MSLWKIAWRSIQRRALASTLTAISMGLGVALVVAVLVIHTVVDQSFRRGGEGYNIIVGAKGGKLELVLNAVYYQGQPVGTLPESYYNEFLEGEFAFDVETAIPICVGHAYQDTSFLVIGTIPEMFEELRYRNNEAKYEFAEGRNFDAAEPFEAVVGHTAAKETRLKVGDRFANPHHGETAEDEELIEFTVVGVLARTGTPNDRAIFINREGFYQIHAGHAEHNHPADGSGKDDGDSEPEADDQSHCDHAHCEHEECEHEHCDHETCDHEGCDHEECDHEDCDHDHADHDHADQDQADHDHETEQPDKAGQPDAHAGHDHSGGTCPGCQGRSVSALLLRVDPLRQEVVKRQINDGVDAQAVYPAVVIHEFLSSTVGDVKWILLIMAVLIVIVAGLGIMVSIYNSMSDRRHEIAVMRALGAGRVTVMLVILFESILLSLGGGLLGVVLGHGLIGLLSERIMEHMNVSVGVFQFQTIELILIPGLILLASVVGYLPAAVAYRTDVARSLTANQ